MTEDQVDWQDGMLKVVVNDEGQYSIWPDDRELPNGWQETTKRGTRQECLEYIDEVWTDMRPRSLRKAMGDEHPDGSPG